MLLSALSLSLPLALAAPLNVITLADVCDGYVITRRASDGAVVIRCPGAPDPWMILPFCSGKTPKVTSVKDPKYGFPKLIIDCSK
jgi:hypothetical protein